MRAGSSVGQSAKLIPSWSQVRVLLRPPVRTVTSGVCLKVGWATQKAKMKLILVRHGETTKNVQGKLHESGDMEMLNTAGVGQMGKTGKRLAEIGVGVVYFSPEVRAKQSAQIIAEVCNCEAREINGLQERNWGVYANQPWSVVSNALAGLDIEERYLYVPPEGESWKIFEERLIQVISRVIKDPLHCVVLVTHGGAIRALMPYLLGVSKEESFKYDPQNGSMSVFEYSAGKFNAVMIDDISHLR